VVRAQNVQEVLAAGARRATRVWMSADVAFIGTWMPERGPLIAHLIERGAPLSISGDRWQKRGSGPPFARIGRELRFRTRVATETSSGPPEFALVCFPRATGTYTRPEVCRCPSPVLSFGRNARPTTSRFTKRERKWCSGTMPHGVWSCAWSC